jgi:hypothetical protein
METSHGNVIWNRTPRGHLRGCSRTRRQSYSARLASVAHAVWLLTTYCYPVDGRKILPLYLVAIGMQFIHLTEEYVADFPDDFSALTGSHLSPHAFVLIAVLAGVSCTCLPDSD